MEFNGDIIAELPACHSRNFPLSNVYISDSPTTCNDKKNKILLQDVHGRTFPTDNKMNKHEFVLRNFNDTFNIKNFDLSSKYEHLSSPTQSDSKLISNNDNNNLHSLLSVTDSLINGRKLLNFTNVSHNGITSKCSIVDDIDSSSFEKVQTSIKKEIVLDITKEIDEHLTNLPAKYINSAQNISYQDKNATVPSQKPYNEHSTFFHSESYGKSKSVLSKEISESGPMPKLIPEVVCLDDDSSSQSTSGSSLVFENLTESPEMPILFPEVPRIKKQHAGKKSRHKNITDIRQPQVVLTRISFEKCLPLHTEESTDLKRHLGLNEIGNSFSKSPEIEEIEGIRFFQFQSMQEMKEFHDSTVSQVVDVDMIVPRKTMDITQIKGWRTKYFVPNSQIKCNFTEEDEIKGDKLLFKTMSTICKDESGVNINYDSSLNKCTKKQENKMINTSAFVCNELDDYLLESRHLKIDCLQRLNPNIKEISQNAEILSLGKLKKFDTKSYLNISKKNSLCLMQKKNYVPSDKSSYSLSNGFNETTTSASDSSDSGHIARTRPLLHQHKTKESSKKLPSRFMKRKKSIDCVNDSSQRVVLRITKGNTEGYKVSDIYSNESKVSKKEPESYIASSSDTESILEKFKDLSDDKLAVIKKSLCCDVNESKLATDFCQNLSIYGSNNEITMLVESDNYNLGLGFLLFGDDLSFTLSALKTNKEFQEFKIKPLSKKKLKAWQKYLPKKLSKSQKLQISKANKSGLLKNETGNIENIQTRKSENGYTDYDLKFTTKQGKSVTKKKKKTKLELLLESRSISDGTVIERGKRSIRLPARYLDSALLTAESEWVLPSYEVEAKNTNKQLHDVLEKLSKSCKSNENISANVFASQKNSLCTEQNFDSFANRKAKRTQKKSKLKRINPETVKTPLLEESASDSLEDISLGSDLSEEGNNRKYKLPSCKYSHCSRTAIFNKNRHEFLCLCDHTELAKEADISKKNISFLKSDILKGNIELISGKTGSEDDFQFQKLLLENNSKDDAHFPKTSVVDQNVCLKNDNFNIHSGSIENVALLIPIKPNVTFNQKALFNSHITSKSLESTIQSVPFSNVQAKPLILLQSHHASSPTTDFLKVLPLSQSAKFALKQNSTTHSSPVEILKNKKTFFDHCSTRFQSSMIPNLISNFNSTQKISKQSQDSKTSSVVQDASTKNVQAFNYHTKLMCLQSPSMHFFHSGNKEIKKSQSFQENLSLNTLENINSEGNGNNNESTQLCNQTNIDNWGHSGPIVKSNCNSTPSAKICSKSCIGTVTENTKKICGDRRKSPICKRNFDEVNYSDTDIDVDTLDQTFNPIKSLKKSKKKNAKEEDIPLPFVRNSKNKSILELKRRFAIKNELQKIKMISPAFKDTFSSLHILCKTKFIMDMLKLKEKAFRKHKKILQLHNTQLHVRLISSIKEIDDSQIGLSIKEKMLKNMETNFQFNPKSSHCFPWRRKTKILSIALKFLKNVIDGTTITDKENNETKFQDVDMLGKENIVTIIDYSNSCLASKMDNKENGEEINEVCSDSNQFIIDLSADDELEIKEKTPERSSLQMPGLIPLCFSDEDSEVELENCPNSSQCTVDNDSINFLATTYSQHHHTDNQDNIEHIDKNLCVFHEQSNMNRNVISKISKMECVTKSNLAPITVEPEEIIIDDSDNDAVEIDSG